MKYCSPNKRHSNGTLAYSTTSHRQVGRLLLKVKGSVRGLLTFWNRTARSHRHDYIT